MYWYSEKSHKTFYTKIPALREDPNIEFCMPRIWDYYDWHIEPEESWDEILRQRAQDLRDKHNYLRLWYSGGADSQTVLNTFIKNGIHLDEVGIWRISPTNNFDADPACMESNEVAIPHIKEVAHKMPGTAIKLYDIGYDSYVHFFENHFDIDRMNYVFDFRLLYSVGVDKFFHGVNDYSGIMNIDGLEKPYIGLDSEGFYWHYSDSTLLAHIVDPKDNIPNTHFFLHPKVHRKQVHMLRTAYLEEPFDLWDRESIDAVVRDPIVNGRTLGKATKAGPAPKTQLTVLETLNDLDKAHLVQEHLDLMAKTGLPSDYFIKDTPIYGPKPIHTKKYRI